MAIPWKPSAPTELCRRFYQEMHSRLNVLLGDRREADGAIRARSGRSSTRCTTPTAPAARAAPTSAVRYYDIVASPSTTCSTALGPAPAVNVRNVRPER